MSNVDIDVRPVLSTIQVPTLVLHPEAYAEEGAFIAAAIPGARLVPTPDAQLLPWLVPDAIDEVEEFLTGARPTPLADRVLATILFTDLVGSTDRVRELGDRAWAELLEQHHALVRRQLERFLGEEIDTAGDGFLALLTAQGARSNAPSRSALSCPSSASRFGLACTPVRSSGRTATSRAASPFISAHASPAAPAPEKCS